jgi:ribosomal protein S18
LVWDRDATSKCRFCRIEGRSAMAVRLAKASGGAKALQSAERAGASEDAEALEGAEDAEAAEGAQTGPATVVAVRQGPAIDYKEVRTLQRLSTPQGKLFSRKRSGTCATHQRQVKRAIKRARFLALLPYVGR